MQLLEAKEGVATAYGRGQQPLEVLEECLVDNLLNFAGTQKEKKKNSMPCMLRALTNIADIGAF